MNVLNGFSCVFTVLNWSHVYIKVHVTHWPCLNVTQYIYLHSLSKGLHCCSPFHALLQLDCTLDSSTFADTFILYPEDQLSIFKHMIDTDIYIAMERHKYGFQGTPNPSIPTCTKCGINAALRKTKPKL